MEKEAIAKMIGILFMARNYAHLAHLAATGKGSYATHMALGGFYDALVGFSDGLAEAVQGKYGLLSITVPEMKGDINNPLEVIKSQAMMIDNLCKKCDTGWIDNMVQEVQSCFYQTIYKLEYLS